MMSGIESNKMNSDYFINLDLLLINGYFNINIKYYSIKIQKKLSMKMLICSCDKFNNFHINFLKKSN